MRTRSWRHLSGISVLVLGACSVASCGGSSPTTGPTPSAETSFLTGTWSGTLTITRTGQPDVTGPTSWTFEIIPQTNRQQFRVRLESTNSWLPITATTTVGLSPTPDPPGRVGGTGSYTSPRNCTGQFVTLGDVTATTLNGTFAGMDCNDVSGFRVPFDGTMRLTKQ